MNFSRIEPDMLCRYVGQESWAAKYTYLTIHKDPGDPEYWRCEVDAPDEFLADIAKYYGEKEAVWDVKYGVTHVLESSLRPLPPPPIPWIAEKEKELES